MSGITLYFSLWCVHSIRFLPIFEKFKKIYCGGAKIKMINIGNVKLPLKITAVPCVVCKSHSIETSVSGFISLKKLEKFVFQHYDKKNKIYGYLCLRKINKLNYQLQKYIIQQFF